MYKKTFLILTFSLLFLGSGFSIHKLSSSFDKLQAEQNHKFFSFLNNGFTLINTAHAAENSDDKKECQIKDKLNPEDTIDIQEITNIIAILNNQKTATSSIKDACLKLSQKYTARKEKLEKKENNCKEAKTELKDMRGEFSKSCAKFSNGKVRCSKAIVACEMCPDKEEDEDEDEDSEEGYNCVKIHKQTQCPALAGDKLKEQKERIDKNKEEIKELKESLNDLETDIAEQETNLNDQLSDLEASFSEEIRDLKRKTEREKEDLENELEKNKAQISQNLSQQIAEVQKEIDGALKIAHAFENAITKTNMDYRKEIRQINMECEIQAQNQLNNYRQRRRRAIQTGNYKISLSSSLAKGRTSFAQKDLARLKNYNTQCLSKRKEDFKSIGIAYKQNLRKIEQQKQQYEDRLKKIQSQLTGLNAQAYKQKNELVQRYSDRVRKVLASHQADYKFIAQNYTKAKNKISAQTKKINVLKTQLARKIQEFEEKQMELLRSGELIAYLEEKGVSSKEGHEDSYSNARSSYGNYEAALSNFYENCDCKSDKNNCKQELARSKKHLTLDDFNSATETDTKSKTRNKNR